MLVRLWQVSGTVRAVSRRLRALVDTHCETALEPLRQILRPLCSDAVVERLARTGDDRKGLFARALDSAVRRVGKIARVTPSHIARARFCPRVDAHETRGQRRARLRACGGRIFAPFAHPTAAHSVRPSVLRKVDRVAVGIPDAGFRFAVGRSFLDVGRGAPLLAHRNQGLNALHLETKMVDPLLELIAFDFAFGADRDDRQVDVTVRQIGSGPHALDDLEAERIGVERYRACARKSPPRAAPMKRAQTGSAQPTPKFKRDSVHSRESGNPEPSAGSPQRDPRDASVAGGPSRGRTEERVDLSLTRTPCSRIRVWPAPSPTRCYRAIASAWRSFRRPKHALRRGGARRSPAPRGSYR